MNNSTINEIQLTGFQSHVDSTISVSPGLTVITGPSDSGKTAIIRAIRWVVFGEPAGDSFVNKAIGQTKVSIHLTTGTVVTKQRKGAKTSYTLENPGEDPMVFDKAETPEEIIKALGIVKTQFGDFETELNFAYQLAAPFLLSEPSSAGAKVLGKLSGTEVVDMAIKAVAKDNYAANQQRLQSIKDIEKTEAALAQFYDLPQQVEQLHVCGVLLERVDAKSVKYKVVAELRDTYSSLAAKVSGYTEFVLRFRNVKKLQESLKAVDDCSTKLSNWKNLLCRFTDNCLQRTNLVNEIGRYSLLPSIKSTLSQVVVNNEKLVTIKKLAGLHRFGSQEIDINKAVINSTINLPKAIDRLAHTEAAITRSQLLQNLVGTHTSSAQGVARYKALIESTAVDHSVIETLKKSEVMLERLQQFRIMRAQYNVACTRMKQCSDTVSTTAGLSQAAEALKTMSVKQSTLMVFKKLQEEYKARNAEAIVASSRLTVHSDSLATAKKELHEMWKEIDVCPTCGQMIGEEICNG